jgi:dihydrofolate synthase / folylpolyglutamate synthase
MLTAYRAALESMCQPVRQSAYPATLRPMQQLLAALGQPHQGLRAIVVAGSTGKGTACVQVARMLRAQGFSVGLYTSPHLHSFRERIVLNDQMIPLADVVRGAAGVAQAAGDLEARYSTFEQTTALALWWFAQHTPDFVVLEIGLGGRWDAVNTVTNTLAVFTPIEMEHTAMLGGTLASIAGHKAGIIQPGGWALTVPQTVEVAQVLRDEAQQQGAHLETVVEDDGDGYLPLAAWANLRSRGLVADQDITYDPAWGALPGRQEHIYLNGRDVIIDGGHTPAAARHLRAAIERQIGTEQPVRLVVGLLADKNAAYLDVFDTPQYHLILTPAPSHRAAPPDRIAEQVHLQQAKVEIEPRLDVALDEIHHAPEMLAVVAGSLRLAAAAREFFGLLTPDELAEAHLTRAVFAGPDYLAKLP